MSSLIPSDLWDEPTLFAEDSPAKTYPLQGSEQDLQAKEPVSSGTHLLSQRMSKHDGLSWKTCLDYLPLIRDAISEQSQLHFPTQGMSTLSGACLIRSSSESPNVAVECSLSQVLISQLTDDRYLLSPKAASGILRRCERKGKSLPEPLREALLSVIRKGLTSKPATELGPHSEAEGGGTLSGGTGGIAPTLDVSLTSKGQMMPDKQRMFAVLNATSVRRLTPVECERLQGFPDNWTEGQADTHRYKQMGNAVTVNVAHYIGSLLADA